MPPLNKYQITFNQGQEEVCAYTFGHAVYVFLECNPGIKETEITKIEKQ